MTWGRPEKPIDWKIVESMIDSQCPGVDIAAHFRIAKQTFYRKFEEHYGTNFSTYVTDNSPGGKAILRLAQFQKALNNKSPGNAQMLIWLGKNLLGQRDHELEKDKMPAFDEKIDAENAEMEEKALLRKQLAELQAKIDHITQTRPELSGIDPQV